MADKFAAFSLATAGSVASYGWLSTANDVATLVVTVIAGLGGLAGAFYWFEKWRAQRAERIEKENK